MKRKMKLVNDSRAVSPVIGVMLMVVVTVVLAAAVSSSSQGILDGTEQTPSAVFSAEIVKDINAKMGPTEGTMSYVNIKHISGDSIDTKDLMIITENPKARGGNGFREIYPNQVNTYTGNYNGTAPMWNQGGLFQSQSDSFFGEYSLEPGRSMMADDWSNYKMEAEWEYSEESEQWDYLCDGFEVEPENGQIISGMHAMFADWDSVESGDHLNIKIIHTPSQKVIFDSDVRVI
ncbi:type IV pilin N-terminal domain-containing protein [Methanococcoides seepicolus]|uniref:Type IV pilin N-terminal domain-containing protein n=1 Tax=Methanococcoides seepicolus TaxID=2828780 RepID=A0A9E5DBM8_9EURY|nr:type IV pilin N-terminal domain-containing protein [Methanococcoides seepicolus]MCM1987820.1 type IV pilin N-terminal domain-containing protein [Methanococcoides seepicolus]